MPAPAILIGSPAGCDTVEPAVDLSEPPPQAVRETAAISAARFRAIRNCIRPSPGYFNLLVWMIGRRGLLNREQRHESLSFPAAGVRFR